VEEIIQQLYVDKYQDFVKIASRLIGGDMYSAEDIVQEAFKRALEYKDSYDEQFGTVMKWFNSILFRCAIDFKKEERLGGMGTELTDDDVVVKDDFGNHNKTLEEIKKDIDALGGENRQICYLYFIKQYKPREIVQITGASSNSVRTAVKRFLQQLREKYE
jgi:RNA polymerase sigma factor (sigma-70 family)